MHTSIRGSLSHAVLEAKKLGCTTFQIFLGSPRSWTFKQRSEEEIEKFRRDLSNLGFNFFAVHSSYLLNPVSTRREVREKSLKFIHEELALASRIGAGYYVIHLRDNLEVEPELQLAELKQFFSKTVSRTGILIENTASGRLTARLDDLLKTFRELKSVNPAVKGLCLDTCHLFAAGNSLTPEELDEIEPAAPYVKLIHLNDSKYPADSLKDRHEHLGMGMIGRDGLRRILQFLPLKDVPVILETPANSPEDDRNNLLVLKELIGSSSDTLSG